MYCIVDYYYYLKKEEKSSTMISVGIFFSRCILAKYSLNESASSIYFILMPSRMFLSISCSLGSEKLEEGGGEYLNYYDHDNDNDNDNELYKRIRSVQSNNNGSGCNYFIYLIG